MTKGQILRYTLLPGVFPRLFRLAGGGLFNIAGLLALIFASVRLLPSSHPYLAAENFRRFGVRHVLAEASSRLVFSRNHLDQIVVYFTILTGIIVLCLQFGLLIAAILSQPVLAQTAAGSPMGSTFADMFTNPSTRYQSYGPEQDLAFIILDKIFGVSGIFGSCISKATQCVDVFGNPTAPPMAFPYPIHIAMHKLLGFYAYGIGIISLMVILYQITTVVGETAASGTPFGRRYNRAWAPVRLILFFALLAPLNVGGGGTGAAASHTYMNLAQLITLSAAKWGSNVATNGWLYYNSTLSTSYLGKPEELVAIPQLPSLAYLTRFYMVVHSCKTAYQYKVHPSGVSGDWIKPYLIRPGSVSTTTGAATNSMLATSADFDSALKFTNNGSITIRFGAENMDSGGNTVTGNAYQGGIFPICGDITLNVGDITQPGAKQITAMYYDLMRAYFDENVGGNFQSMAQIIKYYASCSVDKSFNERLDTCVNGSDYDSSYFASTSADLVNSFFKEEIDDAVKTQIEKGKFTLPEGIKKKGWVGAAIWYNTIAEMNGAVTSAVLNAPTVTRYPEVMRYTEEANLKQAQTNLGSKRFDPDGIGMGAVNYPRNPEKDIAKALYNAYTIFDNNNIDDTPHTRKTGNTMIDAINMLFGTNGLYDIRNNKTINPLAQLSSLGRSMVEQAIRNFGAAIGVYLGEGLLGLVNDNIKGLGAINNFLEAVASIGILIGFILYYVLPFMPFLYFFFAAGEWAKSIFEGIIAMPLWALAHLTIDGQGLPGQAAANGYYLILEIFARPILIFVGLVGSVMAFSASIQMLDSVFDIVVENVSGVSSSPTGTTPTPEEMAFYRGPIDELFFTVLYAILCYMTALSCFKLIDNVPLNILRWMGISAQTYSQLSGNRNPVENLTRTVYSSGAQTMGQVQQGLGGIGLSGQVALALR